MPCTTRFRSRHRLRARHAAGISRCLALLVLATSQAFGQTPDETPFLKAAGQADLSGMPAYFAGAAVAASPMLRELEQGFQARFVSRSEPLSPATDIAFIDEAVASFREFWSEALMNPADAANARQRLMASLQLLTGESGSTNALFDAVSRMVENHGYGISISPAPPLDELLVWGAEAREFHRVELTDSTETVEVVFVDNLVSAGWRHFASLGLNATSGWTTGDVLYCVRFSYDPGGEPFRVSYLKHETRHFADFRRFPGLDETTMEYRAKLTELAFANLTAPILLRRFALERDAKGTSAHLRANDRVSQDLYREVYGRPMPEDLTAWPADGVSRARFAARTLLDRNTTRLESGGVSAAGSQ